MCQQSEAIREHRIKKLSRIDFEAVNRRNEEWLADQLVKLETLKADAWARDFFKEVK